MTWDSRKAHPHIRAGFRSHVLSWTLCNVAVINLIFAGAGGLVRITFNRADALNPDMLNAGYWRAQLMLSLVQVAVIGLQFFLAYRTLQRQNENRAPVEAADGHVVLSGGIVLQLLEVWAVVLVGIKLADLVLTDIYRNFVADLFALFDLADANAMAVFRTMYNNTHAFKYIGMLVAISLGMFITGVMLGDRIMKITAAGLIAVFILTASLVQMGTYVILDRAVAIVWSSVILQLLQTFGLLGFAFYLHRRYRRI